MLICSRVNVCFFIFLFFLLLHSFNPSAIPPNDNIIPPLYLRIFTSHINPILLSPLSRRALSNQSNQSNQFPSDSYSYSYSSCCSCSCKPFQLAINMSSNVRSSPNSAAQSVKYSNKSSKVTI